MSFFISGLMVIPEDPKLDIFKPASAGLFLNFRATTQGRTINETIDYQYWNCSLWIPEDEEEEWLEDLVPGTVFLIQQAEIISQLSKDQRFTNTKIKLDRLKTKKLSDPLWIQK